LSYTRKIPRKIGRKRRISKLASPVFRVFTLGYVHAH